METKFKRVRVQNKVSQDSVAKSLNISVSCLSAWENGTRFPTGKNLAAFMELFDLDEDFLLEDNIPFVNVDRCFNMAKLNAKGAKKLYDFYLELLEDKENLKKY